MAIYEVFVGSYGYTMINLRKFGASHRGCEASSAAVRDPGLIVKFCDRSLSKSDSSYTSHSGLDDFIGVVSRFKKDIKSYDSKVENVSEQRTDLTTALLQHLLNNSSQSYYSKYSKTDKYSNIFFK